MSSMRVRFITQGEKTAIEYRFDTDHDWSAFGDPVPTFKTGPLAGFEVHDLYHLTLLAETGWSAVLGILLCGDRAGVFGGPGALAEEGVVMDWFLRAHNSPAKSTALLNAVGANVEPTGVERSRVRGLKAVEAAKARLAATGTVTLTIADVPAAFKVRALAARKPVSKPAPKTGPAARGPSYWARRSA